jgi:hypothetical protein
VGRDRTLCRPPPACTHAAERGTAVWRTGRRGHRLHRRLPSGGRLRRRAPRAVVAAARPVERRPDLALLGRPARRLDAQPREALAERLEPRLRRREAQPPDDLLRLVEQRGLMGRFELYRGGSGTRTLPSEERPSVKRQRSPDAPATLPPDDRKATPLDNTGGAFSSPAIFVSRRSVLTMSTPRSTANAGSTVHRASPQRQVGRMHGRRRLPSELRVANSAKMAIGATTR